MTYRCEALQQSDSMVCESCRSPKGRPLVWDVNDPEPPPCSKRGVRGPQPIREAIERAQQALDDRLDETMVSEGSWAAVVRGLLAIVRSDYEGTPHWPEKKR